MASSPKSIGSSKSIAVSSNSESSDFSGSDDEKEEVTPEIAASGGDTIQHSMMTFASAGKSRRRKTAASSTSIKSRERSEVWEHFKKFDKPVFEMKDGKLVETGVEKRARCIHCGSDLACDSYGNGTTSLRRHLMRSCKKFPGSINLEHTQRVFTKGGGSLYEPQLSMVAFDSDLIMKALVEMIVIDEHAFSMTEKLGFTRFMRVACPRFNLPSRKFVVNTFWKQYEVEKKKLKDELRAHCVNITTDTWTSVQNINYMVITAHFIDSNWTLHKRILNFCVIPNHKGITIGKILEACLIDWGIERVMTVSVDNASANKVAIEYLREKMMTWAHPPVLEGKYLHVRCLAHILNLIVKSGLNSLEKSVAAIRNAIRYVRSSPARLEVFKGCVEKEKLDSRKVCILDVPSRWNSTYKMMDVAIELRKAFDRMADEEEGKYRAYFNEPEVDDEEEGECRDTETESAFKDGEVQEKRKRVGPPASIDWERATVFVNFLKVFHDVTMRISASNSPTAQKAFHDIVAIDAEINDLFVQREVGTVGSVGNNSGSTQTHRILTDMASKMRVKFDKYFKNIDDMNQLLLVAVVLDPRYKLRNFDMVCSNWLHMDSDMIKEKSGQLKDLVVKLTNLYATLFGTKKNKQKGNGAYSCSTSSSRSSRGSGRSSSAKSFMSGKMAAMEADWKRELENSEQLVVNNEVDRYLMEAIEDPAEDEEWKLSTWWSQNGAKYPNLALVAKDILSIQVSTVASESCFSTGRRVIDPFRSSLSPKTVEALICYQNWLRGESIAEIEYVPTVDDMMFYEDAEKEHLIQDTAAKKGKAVTESPSPSQKKKLNCPPTSKFLKQQVFCTASGKKLPLPASPAKKKRRTGIFIASGN